MTPSHAKQLLLPNPTQCCEPSARVFISSQCQRAAHPSETVPSLGCCLCRKVPLSFSKGLSSRARLCHPPPALPIIFHLFEPPAGLQPPQIPHSPLQHCPIKYTLDPSVAPKALFPPHDGYKQPQKILGHQQKLSDAHPSPHHQAKL